MSQGSPTTDGRWPTRGRLAAAAVATLAYLATTVALPVTDETAADDGAWMVIASVWFVLVATAGWLLGRRAGVLFGLALMPLQMLALLLFGREQLWATSGGGTAWVIGFNLLFSLFAGAIGDYSREARARSRELAAKNAKLEEATQALARSEAMFRQFAERVDQGVWIASGEGLRDLYVNRAMREFYGEDPARFTERVHPDDRSVVHASTEALRAGRAQELEHRLARADGSVQWVRARSLPVLDNEGRLTSLVGIVEDVTEEKEREKTRELLARRERLTALGTLVAGVAHEVNNPLTYLAGNMQLAHAKLRALTPLPQDRASVERIDRLLATSIEGADRIAKIVRALRAATRVSVEGGSELVRLNAIAANVHELMLTSVPPTLELRLDLAPEDPAVVGKGSELHQVLLNLATNAVQAMGARRGAVTIETRAIEGEAHLVVKDDGPGIPDDVRARLFTPFFTTKPDGTGLGLNIAHAIARDHGGDVEVESRVGGGALFRVRLPAMEAHTPEVTA